MNPGRSKRSERWLELQRVAHTSARPSERTNGAYGSAYSATWGFTEPPTPTQAPGDHVTPVEWMSATDLVIEQRNPRQLPVNIVICNESENSKKSDNAIGCFYAVDYRIPRLVYRLPDINEPKRALLAKKVACFNIMYFGVTDRKRTKGQGPFTRAVGIETYAQGLKEDGRLADAVRKVVPVNDWERRIELLNSALWSCHNALVFNSSLFNLELKTLLAQRFEGAYRSLKPSKSTHSGSLLATHSQAACQPAQTSV
jgi:hypothetical protein